ncbi:hypothetical protein ACP70R_008579 [Stipagrostis hirtigluma subsp. patula]
MLVVAAGLPNDVLAIVLGRLPTRSLAASRCICRAWRDLIDGHRLLLPHLLPHKVSGLFLNYIGNATPHYFTRPVPAASGGARVDGGVLDAVVPDCRHEWAEVNGLVLYSHSTSDVRVQPRDAAVGAHAPHRRRRRLGHVAA